MNKSNELTVLQDARTALSQVMTVNDAREIRDKADAVRHYAQQAKLGQELIVEAAVLKLHAERRLGQILSNTQLATGMEGNQHDQSSGEPNGVLLSELGISRSESSRMQRIAKLNDEIFEAYIQAEAESQREPTIAGVMRLVRQSKSPSSPAKRPSPINYDSFASVDELIQVDRRFRTVLITPPFETHTAEQLEDEPIRNLLDSDVCVYFWTQLARLLETIDLADVLGLAYHDAIVSIPPKNLAPEQASHLLLRFQLGDGHSRVTGTTPWLACPQPEGLGVPNAVRHFIEQHGHPPFLELFAKTPPPSSDWAIVHHPNRIPMT